MLEKLRKLTGTDQRLEKFDFERLQRRLATLEIIAALIMIIAAIHSIIK